MYVFAMEVLWFMVIRGLDLHCELFYFAACQIVDERTSGDGAEGGRIVYSVQWFVG